MSEYKSFSKVRKMIKAPAPEFALDEERASDPEYVKARKMQDHPIDFVNDEIQAGVDGYLEERGLPRANDPFVGGLTFGQIADAGNIVGAIKAPTAAGAVSKAAKEAPASFGRILQVVKEEVPSADKAVKRFGRILFKKQRQLVQIKSVVPTKS